VLRDGAEACVATDPAQAAEMLAEAAYAAGYTGSGDMTALARRAWELAPAEDPKARCLASIALGAALVLGGDPAAGEPLEDAASLIAASPELRDDLELAAWLGVVPAFQRADVADYDPLVRSIALARERGAIGVLPVALFYLGVGLFAAGRWAQSAAAFTEAVRLGDEAGLRVDAAASLSGLAWLEARRGDGTLAATALDCAREAGLPFFEAWAVQARGETALAAGDAEAALAAFEAKRRLLDEHGLVDPDVSPGPELAETLVHLGRDEEAREVAARALAEAEAKGQPWALARAGRARALTEPDDEAALAAFAGALGAHDSFEDARTRLCLGERLRRIGRRAEARAPLREALTGFERLGASPWSARAAAELQATGEVVRRRDPASLDELTPQELRVATTLAAGATTRQAAAALYLSPKTVEYHLRHVYLKLGINSRAALASALATAEPPARD
jgi:DNA-binding CsgD family transcriptional regulator